MSKENKLTFEGVVKDAILELRTVSFRASHIGQPSLHQDVIAANREINNLLRTQLEFRKLESHPTANKGTK